MTVVKWNGEDKSLTVLCRELRVSRNTVRKRLLRGWTIKDAVDMSIKRRPVYPSDIKGKHPECNSIQVGGV